MSTQREDEAADRVRAADGHDLDAVNEILCAPRAASSASSSLGLDIYSGACPIIPIG